MYYYLLICFFERKKICKCLSFVVSMYKSFDEFWWLYNFLNVFKNN